MSHEQAQMFEHRKLILQQPRSAQETRRDRVKIFRAWVQAALRAFDPEEREENKHALTPMESLRNRET